MTHALILFAHGARDPQWSQPFERVAEQVRALHPGTMVRLAFLEFMPPTLAQAGAEVAQAGATSVSVVPMFLGAGGHVRRDLPALLQALQQQHPQVRWSLRPAIGEAPAVIEAMAREVADPGDAK
ncbi:MAG: sirohydrochlorin chelatase [Rubrivivax sp.]